MHPHIQQMVKLKEEKNELANRRMHVLAELRLVLRRMCVTYAGVFVDR